MSVVLNPKNGFTFTAPTKNTDGSAVATGEIVKYQLGIGTKSGVYDHVIDDADLTPDTAGLQHTDITVVQGFGNGTFYAAVRAVTAEGLSSAWSSEVSYTIAPTPSAPANFSIA